MAGPLACYNFPMSHSFKLSKTFVARFFILLLSVSFGLLIYVLIFNAPIIYVSPFGNDANPGTKAQPVKSIMNAYRRIRIGGTIRLQSGMYRESVSLLPKPFFWGSITIEGPSDSEPPAVISGSESSRTTTWTRCTTESCPMINPAVISHVYVGRWSQDKNPSIITQITADGTVHTLPVARTPNISITDPDKWHENWWAADTSNASSHTLTDTQSRAGLQPGNLTTLGSVVGADAVMIDGNRRCGGFMYVRRITQNDQAQGTITFDQPVGASTYGIQENGIGPYVKYYLKNKPTFLDSPGEWYFDVPSTRLYVWPLQDDSPSTTTIEIGVRDTGIGIHTSNIRLRHLTVAGINDVSDSPNEKTGAIVIGNDTTNIHNISLAHISLQNAGTGIAIGTAGQTSITSVYVDRLTIQDIAESAVLGVGTESTPSNIRGVRITNSVFRHAGSEINSPAISLTRVWDVLLSGNRISDSSDIGIFVKSYETNPGSVRNITVSGNDIRHVCQNASDCAAVKFFGGNFTGTEISGNTLTDNLGWSYCNEMSNHIVSSAAGIFISNASGITVEGNVSARNAIGILAYPRQFLTMNNIFRHNRIQNARTGIRLESAEGEIDNNPRVYASRHNGTVISDNSFNNVSVALSIDPAEPKTMTINDNRYVHTDVVMNFRNTTLLHAADVSVLFPYWETRSQERP